MARPKKQTDREVLDRLLRLVEEYLLNPSGNSSNRVYDNKALMELLQIKDKYLKRLRDNGYLSYSKHGEKYWYSQADVDNFLKKFHFDAFASGDLAL